VKRDAAGAAARMTLLKERPPRKQEHQEPKPEGEDPNKVFTGEAAQYKVTKSLDKEVVYPGKPPVWRREGGKK